jgi:hypothetical protein
MSDATKTCNKCRLTKPFTSEFFHRARPGKLHGRCKECRCADFAAQYAAAPEMHRLYVRKSYLKHRARPRIRLTDQQLRAHEKARMQRWLATNKEHKRLLDREYAAKHRSKAIERVRKWYRANKERAAADNKRRRMENPEQYRVYSRNRKARARGAVGHHTQQQTAAIRRKQTNKCAYCKRPLGRKGHLDHIEPLARGGTNWPKNLQWLCAPCNLAKRAKDPVDYAQSIGLLL